jgi:hypothetical protein
MYERQVLLADTIIRDLPRLRDTEAISRDTYPCAINLLHQPAWLRNKISKI